MSKKQLNNQIKQLTDRKEQLLKLKASAPLSEKDQAELDEITEKLFDLNEQLESLDAPKAPEAEAETAKAPEAEAAKAPEAETEQKPKAPVIEEKPAQRSNVVRLKIQNGKRFDANTGKEINPPIEQTFTWSEWLNFKQFHSRCGYKIVEVLDDPFGEAAQFVEK